MHAQVRVEGHVRAGAHSQVDVRARSLPVAVVFRPPPRHRFQAAPSPIKGRNLVARPAGVDVVFELCCRIICSHRSYSELLTAALPVVSGLCGLQSQWVLPLRGLGVWLNNPVAAALFRGMVATNNGVCGQPLFL
jgi:hypothetical protein